MYVRIIIPMPVNSRASYFTVVIYIHATDVINTFKNNCDVINFEFNAPPITSESARKAAPVKIAFFLWSLFCVRKLLLTPGKKVCVDPFITSLWRRSERAGWRVPSEWTGWNK